MVWIGPRKLRVVAAPMPAHVARPQVRHDLVQDAGTPPGGPATRPRSAAGTSRSPSPGSGRRSAPCRRAPAPGCPAAALRVSADTSSEPKMRWRGSRRPRLMPYSGSPSAAATPWISLMPGQTPPESCQPPPEPASHSPRMARAATSRRSLFRQRPRRASASARWRACRPRSGRPAGWSRRPAASPSGCR